MCLQRAVEFVEVGSSQWIEYKLTSTSLSRSCEKIRLNQTELIKNELKGII